MGNFISFSPPNYTSRHMRLGDLKEGEIYSHGDAILILYRRRVYVYKDHMPTVPSLPRGV
ncbi:MAG: hypothetical protein ACK4SY_03805 [Pyrobaculum sp.]